MSKKKEFPILDEMERLLGRYGTIGVRELMLRLERLELEAEPREPEKLNNAHYDAITCTNDRSVALAESSLSSPPPFKHTPDCGRVADDCFVPNCDCPCHSPAPLLTQLGAGKEK